MDRTFVIDNGDSYDNHEIHFVDLPEFVSLEDMKAIVELRFPDGYVRGYGPALTWLEPGDGPDTAPEKLLDMVGPVFRLEEGDTNTYAVDWRSGLCFPEKPENWVALNRLLISVADIQGWDMNLDRYVPSASKDWPAMRRSSMVAEYGDPAKGE